MRHGGVLIAAILAMIAGCGQGGTFRIFVEFPDDDAFEQTGLLRIYAVECAEQAACGALTDGRALPGDEGYPVEARLEIDLQGAGADWRLSDVGPGRRLFYAEAIDSEDAIILMGCTDIEAGGGGEQEVKIVLARVTRTCMKDEDCDDGDICTRDICNEEQDRCENPGVTEPPGEEGPVGDPTCDDGVDNDCDHKTDADDTDCKPCVSDSDCDDDNLCTKDRCEDDRCVHENLPEGTPCEDDGQYCNGSEECNGNGFCVSLGNPCPQTPCNSCHEDMDSCYDPAGSSCDDGRYCNGEDTCDGAGTCVHSGDPCPDAECRHCNEVEDACADPVGTPCADDGRYCTGPEECDGTGHCASTGDPCPPGDECNRCNETDRSCLSPQGAPCGDASNTECTDPDACDGSGSCDPNHESPQTPCEDGQYCNGADTCDGAGTCAHAGSPCPETECNRCNETAGSCHSPQGTPCGDASDTECTDPDTCDGVGSCRPNHEPPGAPCGDASNTECTDPDACDGSGSCDPNHESPGTPCEDGQYCNGADTCDGAGTCAHAGSPCPETECKHCQEITDSCHDPAGTGCEDGMYCTVNDACDGAGQCGAGTPRDCSMLDGQCAAGICDEGGDSCVADPFPDWTECDDGNPETFQSFCLSGACLAVGPLPDTNQRDCYEVDSNNVMTCWGNPGEPECAIIEGCGQDAQYGWDLTHGPDERFGVLDPAGTGEEVVMDWVTGLQWRRTHTSEYHWEDARDWCLGLVYAGYDDWRLPDRHELFSLVDFGRTASPAIDIDAFPGTPVEKFWTGTEDVCPDPFNNDKVWVVNFVVCSGVVSEDKDSMMSWHHVRCVRGTPRTPTYLEEGTAPEKTVLDQLTGLMWQRTVSSTKCHYWKEALVYCEGLEYAGYDDWRLPDIKELDSLVDATRCDPAIDPDDFGGTFSDLFWSSTSKPQDTLSPKAGVVNFHSGSVGYAKKDDFVGLSGAYIRCVRWGPW